MIRCGMCGSTNLKKENIKGSTHPWRDHLAVVLDNDQDVLVCQECKNHILSSKDISNLETNIRASLGNKIILAINSLTKDQGLTQQELADALGVNTKCLSKVLDNKKFLSFTEFNLLMLYFENPNFITKLSGIELKKNS